MVEEKSSISIWCDCSLPDGSVRAHCRVCCSTFLGVGLFDSHRISGECYDLEGVYEEDGVYATQEGHTQRKLLAERLSRARSVKLNAKS